MFTGGADGIADLITTPIEKLLTDAGLNAEQVNRVMSIIKGLDLPIPALRPLAAILMAAITYPSLFLALMKTLGQVIAKPVYSLIRPSEHDTTTLDRLLIRRAKPTILDPNGKVTEEAINKAREDQKTALDDKYGVIGESKEQISERIEANAPVMSATDWIDKYMHGFATRADASIALSALGYGAKDINKILDDLRTNIGPERMLELRNRGVIDKWSKETDWLRRAGIVGVEESEALGYLINRVPNVGDLGDWVNRGAIKERDYDRMLKAAGYGNPLLHPEFKEHQLSNLDTSDGDPIRALIRSSAWQVPTLKDLIQFAVKDAFDANVIKRFQLFDEFPGDTGDDVDRGITDGFQHIAPKVAKAKTTGQAFRALCDAAGVSQAQAKLEWGAHWNLPAPGQVFDMFFRNAIDQDTVNDYLKAADYSKFWRSKMLAIQYNLLSRTDLEACYVEGVLSGSEVAKGLELLGYSKDNAANLAEMIRRRVHYNLIHDAIDNILAAYRRDEITRQEAKNLIDPISPSPDYTAFALNESATKKDIDKKLLEATGTVRQVEETRNVAKGDILRALKRGVIDDGEAKKMLEQIGYNAPAAQFLVDQLRLTQTLDSKDKQVNLVEKQYLAGVIDDREANRQLSSLSLPMVEITRLMFDFRFAKQAQANLDRRQDKTASVAELKRWLKIGILTEAQWTEEMRKTGVTEFVIGKTLEEINKGLTED